MDTKMENNQVQRLYNAIIARGTGSVPTYAEVQRDARRDVYNSVSIQTRF